MVKIGHQASWHEPTLIKVSSPGKRAYVPEMCPFPDVTDKLPAEMKRKEPAGLPELSEAEIVRHYVRLSQMNHGVDLGPYLLGSCTMKYNPKINETIARFPKFVNIHPKQPDATVQGSLELLYRLQEALKAISGFDATSLHPAAGAHGEFTALKVFKAYHKKNGQGQRTEIIIPDSAHGTNPASSILAGFSTLEIISGEDGLIDIEALKGALSDKTAGIMITNPNTIGVFEKDIVEICKLVHEAGGLVYLDGANLNGIMGVVLPSEMGFDVMHANLHKTFASPHGGGGPGSGAIMVTKELEPFLPAPVVKYDEAKDYYYQEYDLPDAIGAVHSYYGNFGVCLRALAYIYRLGGDGIREACENAVLNANYLMHRFLELDGIEVPRAEGVPRKHEFIASPVPLKEETGISAMEIAKAMLDYQIHCPTVYFPLIVPEALMVEPTEIESKISLDYVADVMAEIVRIAREDPEKLHKAPFRTAISKVDDVTANRSPVLSWKMMED